MLAYLQAHLPQAGAVLVIALLAFKWLAQSGLLAKLRLPAFKSGPDDAGDFAALAKLRKRFEAANCAEGVAACDTLLNHFFHHG